MVKEKIVQIVSKYLDSEISDRDCLLLEYGLDSLKLIQIIVEVEEYYGIFIPSELLVIENWDTIAKIQNIVDELL